MDSRFSNGMQGLADSLRDLVQCEVATRVAQEVHRKIELVFGSFDMAKDLSN